VQSGEKGNVPFLEEKGNVPFSDAARFWLRLGFVSFGGPAGQIAILHREVVERRGWLGERDFAGALNFCMLLPGPEALQLAIYLGWRLHGIRGGLVAGLGFIGPAIVLLLILSWLYARYGSLPAATGVLLGLKAAVLALVLQALVRIGRRALTTRLHVALAVAAFVALELLGVPFPLIVLAAALIGLASAWRAPRPPHEIASEPQRGRPLHVAIAGLALWLAPLVAVALALGPQSLWTRLYLFFTQTALVTFGGAYAVLGYVTQVLVDDLGWLTAQQAVAGLALAETTPGPLVIVLQFMGFMAGWNQPGPLAPAAAAVLAALLASWATFLPSFVFIFLGAPWVERLQRMPRASAALAAVTAAVVGIIATLLVLLARVLLLPDGLAGGVHFTPLALAAALWLLLERGRLELHWVLVLAALAGLALQAAGLA
jgi:chromate transporter